MLGSRCIGCIAILVILLSCRDKEAQGDPYIWKSIKVTATAYNSFPSQTSYEHPGITAWGDTLIPGMKCIAVSRDLISKGLTHNTMVKIDRMDGVYLVKDKMHGRWSNRIDIYMGVDRQEALEWGRKKVWIKYAVKRDSVPKPPESD
ncbi:3D domain-containing protein [Flavobacteriaceae bacterium F89]|uniref:3D domain-containing protein n=1 Tax=Cerina litoralis TaxID=2874477 RepID=A0AAE3EX98_9FLAO|nr:hypothetical protein [Cerina litoralis]MCG2461814.1 3D domain-containing protein [Cerina litoralis]